MASTKSFDPIHLGPITITFSVDAEMSKGTATMSRCDVAGGAGLPLPAQPRRLRGDHLWARGGNHLYRRR